jgi:hypothetical protein
MKELMTLEQYQTFLEKAPSQVLQAVAMRMAQRAENLSEDTPEFQAIAAMFLMLNYEFQLRQVEPLWRKAKRFAIRNSDTIKEVGKIAACIGVGVLLGVGVDK